MNEYLPPLISLATSLLLIWGRGHSKTLKRSLWRDAAIILVIITIAALLEFAMGRTPSYKYGPISIWSQDINSNQNSQQIADPYTLTHITHGVLLYGFLCLFLKRLSLRARALLAIGAESAWEVFENTDMVINRYRAATISLDYFGDSIVNSVFDIFAALLGFVLAARLPTRVTVASVIVLEIVLALWIRDSLFLNIIMLIYPIQAIKNWQGG